MKSRKTFFVAYAGEYVRIVADSEETALNEAKKDYEKPPTKRRLDWKDSEHTDETWDVIEN